MSITSCNPKIQGIKARFHVQNSHCIELHHFSQKFISFFFTNVLSSDPNPISMRKALVLSAIMIACLELNAQSIDRSVVASSGEEFTTSVGIIANTIGEPVTATLVGGNATLTQGFHQGIINITSIREQITEDDILVYPNPTSDMVQVNFDGERSKWQLHTMDGKLVNEGILVRGTNSIDMRDLSQATYFLTVSGKDNNRNTYRIQKIR
jgi:hypothetical protein